ncbi:hypothetical protein [Christiangramia echinicola]|uniref:Lipoprotein n=1 Tax=Christiangramia echinicola TaxID=279359 RepID=A0A1H1ML59_9FLAO|nr:hypothetical protein [Christiangramia echinicola]SDR87417.1 hypothetical protein SAMN04488552_1351 [Christiangramia echinicola]
MKIFKVVRFFVILLLSSSLSSCSGEDSNSGNDKENTNKKGEIDYNGTKINLTQGVITSYQAYDTWGYPLELNIYNIELFTEGIDFETQNNKVTGEGSIIHFELITSQTDGLEDGTYTFNPDYENFSLRVGKMMYEFNTDTEEAEEISDSTNGEIVVSKSGGTYSLSFYLTLDNGKNLTGEYQGDLTAF